MLSNFEKKRGEREYVVIGCGGSMAVGLVRRLG